MKSGSLYCLVFSFIFLSFYSLYSQLPLRCAYYCPTPQDMRKPIPTNYLKRVAQAGYTHVLFMAKSQYSLDEIKQQFIQIDVQYQGRLKGIPLLEVGSKWSGAWGITNKNHLNRTKSPKGRTFTLPSYAYDPELTVKIRESLKKIQQAYRISNAQEVNGQHLQYLFMSHDEPCDNNQLLIANGNQNQSLLDRNFIEELIRRENISVEIAFRRIIVHELELRIKDMESVKGLEHTRLIIFADMWDPEANGGCRFKVDHFPHSDRNKPLFHPSLIKIRLAPNHSRVKNEIIDLPGCEDATKIKQKVILAPWCYNRQWKVNRSNPDPPYRAHRTFRYFAENGFDFIFTASLNTYANRPITKDKKEAVRAYKKAYANLPFAYQKKCLGYIAASWTNDQLTPSGAWSDTKTLENQTNNFKIIEFLHKLFIQE